jgi:predicted phosphoadenosine phosphosulfate sulfurtransferase
MQKDKESVVQLMIRVFENANRFMAVGSGMTEEEAEKAIEQARPSMIYFMSAIYDKLEENDLLKSE